MNELVLNINSLIIAFSIIGIISGFIILILNLFKRLVKKELIILGLIFFSSFLLRFFLGSFSPWRQQEHYFQVFFSLKENFLYRQAFNPPYIYLASVGLFEAFYGLILQFFSQFNIYNVYYISLAISVASGLLIFLLALQLFKNKKIAYISYLIFSFFPILIKISASEILFILNGFTLLLFLAYLFYMKEKEIFWWDYLIFLSLLCANLVGRLEYLSFFPLLIFICLIFFSLMDKNIKNYLKENLEIKIILLIFFIISGFYFLYYIFPVGSKSGELIYRLRRLVDWKNHLKFFWYTDETHQATYPFLKSHFTPFYIYILFLISPIFVLIKKKWKIMIVMLLSIPFLLFYSTAFLTDFRRVLPLLLAFIPVMGWTFFRFLKYLKIPEKYILLLASFIIILSPLQNINFLNAKTGRKVEQDFMIEKMKEIPSGSLILTVNDPLPGYDKYKFEKNNNRYTYTQEKAVFNSYLIPENKKIEVMDIHKEYNPSIIEQYENVFYYRSLYSYHDREASRESEFANKKIKTPWEVTASFENEHELIPLFEKEITNVLYDIRKVEDFKRSWNYSINASGDLLVGFYKLK